MEDLVEEGACIDRLRAGTRIGAAVGAEPGHGIDIVAARRADDAVRGDVQRIGGHRGCTFISTEKVDVTGSPFCVAGLKRQFCTEAIRRGLSPGIDCDTFSTRKRPPRPTLAESPPPAARSALDR